MRCDHEAINASVDVASTMNRVLAEYLVAHTTTKVSS